MPYTDGQASVDQSSWSAAENSRTLAGGGGGVGMCYLNEKWRAELIAAWRTQGDAPLSDTHNKTLMVWTTLGYRF